MKVLHISSSDQLDSASRAAGQLHGALLKAGIDSQMRVRDQLPARPNGSSDPAGIIQSFCLDGNETNSTASAFHLGYPEADLSALVADFDLIHLHQVAGVLSPENIRNLAALGKPIVWSLPDAWAFTGGCFEPVTCRLFSQSCSNCPQLHEDSFQLPARLLKDRLHCLSGLQNLTVVVPNDLLESHARESRAFKALRVEQIPPLCPTVLSATAQMPSGTDQPLGIVFVCDSPGSAFRSARLLADLLEVTQTYGAFRKLVLSGKVLLSAAGFGAHAATVEKATDLPVSFVEGIPARQGDLLVFPKPDENRTTAVLEARNHGIPMLAFDQGGIGQFIQHRKNGWLVGRTELRPLAEALCYLAANPAMVRAMRQPASVEAETSLSRFTELYQRLLATPVAIVSEETPGESMESQFQEIVYSIARTAIAQRPMEIRLARLDAASKRLAGAEELLADAQASLGKLEQRQKRLIDSGQLPQASATELQKILRTTMSLRNKLKWRARRLKVYNSAEHSLARNNERALHSPHPPRIPAWAKWVHRWFLQNHWMKHGKKDQYPPRPMRGESFPKPKLRDTELPKIAVVTPSFMQGCYLEATIQSIVDQNYPNLAYAVHDGGSTDVSLDVIRKHADRITLWASEPDSGQARAIVSGFEKIEGEIMAWVNSDDMLVPGCLRYIGEYFATHPEVDAIYGNRIIVNEHGKEIARWVLPPHEPALTAFLDPVPQETLFWRKSLWDQVGGLDPSFRFALDWDLVMRFQQAGATIVRLPYFLGCFRVHSQQKLSARAESIGAEEIAYVRQRATGRPVTLEEIQPYKRWMETSAAIYSRLLELGIRR